MYNDAVDSIHNHLIQKSKATKMTYTAELIPEQHAGGEMYALAQHPPTSCHLIIALTTDRGA